MAIYSLSGVCVGLLMVCVFLTFLTSGELFLPASAKWVTGTIKRRPVLCYLYSNALVVIAKDKKVSSALSLSLSLSLSQLFLSFPPSTSLSFNPPTSHCHNPHTHTQIKSRSQIFPLCGASVYEHVSRTGEVTYARDPGTYIHT